MPKAGIKAYPTQEDKDRFISQAEADMEGYIRYGAYQFGFTGNDAIMFKCITSICIPGSPAPQFRYETPLLEYICLGVVEDSNLVFENDVFEDPAVKSN